MNSTPRKTRERRRKALDNVFVSYASAEFLVAYHLQQAALAYEVAPQTRESYYRIKELASSLGPTDEASLSAIEDWLLTMEELYKEHH